MLRNPPAFLRRLALALILIVAVREMSIRRNQPALTDWPRRSDATSDEPK